MAEAAAMYEKTPTALRLRELQTLAEIAREKNLIVVTTTGASADLATLIGLLKGEKAKSE
jgi:regulator of protease activity HflC (stomatin/prohibitin superfamily)